MSQRKPRRLWLNIGLGLVIIYLVTLMNLVINYVATAGRY